MDPTTVPTNIRATGVAVPYAITVSILGGTAPAIALYFKQQGHEQWFYYYLAGMICVSLVVYATMRDTKHASAMHRHDLGGSAGLAGKTPERPLAADHR